MKPQPLRRVVRRFLEPAFEELGFRHIPHEFHVTDFRRDLDGHTQHVGFDRPYGESLRLLLSRDMPPQVPHAVEGPEPVDGQGPDFDYETQEELERSLERVSEYIKRTALLWLADPYANGFSHWRALGIVTWDVRNSRVVVTWQSGAPANHELVALKNVDRTLANRPILQLRDELLASPSYQLATLPHSQAIDLRDSAINAGLQATIEPAGRDPSHGAG